MSELVQITISDHIAEVRLNRPEKMNALSIEMFEAVNAAAESIKSNRDVRAVVLTGEGRSFCAGLDLANFTDPTVAVNGPFGDGRGGHWPNFYQKPGYLWKSVPVPVIAAVHGAVFGGGLQIALGADIRIAAPDTKMSFMEIKWGLIPDMSGSQTLRDLVRMDVAKELFFTGRVVESAEAKEIGLVTRISDNPREAAFEIAREIAKKNPQAITLCKLLVESAWHGDDKRGLEIEEKLQESVMLSKNQMEAVMAGMQKREPTFTERTLDHIDPQNPFNGITPVPLRKA